ncbi:hypothetical protein ACQEVF_52005 [Nonomuraea polychroma]|uniref:hypothetical protein n=1 Tax=Nonomuraea polychroma TaxID=46176 RepID=UPI003D8F0ABF
MRARLGLAVGLLAGAAVGVSGVAIASATSTNVITACVRADGTVRIPAGPTSAPESLATVRPTATSDGLCEPGEQELSWNHVGPQGPQGSPGPTGPQGPAGAPGAQGLVDLQRVGADKLIQPGQGDYVTASCPEGKVAFAGRHKILYADGSVYSYADVRIADAGVSVYFYGSYYSLYAKNFSNEPVTIRVWAECAKRG